MKVGICAIIKDCPEKDLLEWYHWHHSLGVDLFFIYDNESEIPIQQTLKDLPGVTVLFWTGKHQQLDAYNHCLRYIQTKPGWKCDWLAFIDDDEFIMIESGNIKQLLSQYTDSALVLNWITFGPCDPGQESLPQTEKYTKHVPVSAKVNQHVKSIVRPSRVNEYVNPHFADYVIGNAVDIRGRKVVGPFVKNPVNQGAWINHYYCKSEKEFAHKVRKGRVDSPTPYSMDLYHAVKQEAIETSEPIPMKKNKYNRVVDMRNAEGAQGLEDLISHLKKTQDVSNMTMVEIGCYAGQSTVIFAKHFKQVIAIDPFMDNYDDKDDTCRQAPMAVVKEKFQETIAPFQNILHICKTSNDAIHDLPDFQFVYIDGNHSYEFVKQDIQNYGQRIPVGAFIAGHDYGPWLTVKKAVDETLGKPDVVFMEGSWLHRKKPERKPVALITPTGVRPDQIQLCAKQMLRQTYMGKVIWVVVDDGEQSTTDFIPEDFRRNWEIIKVQPDPKWKPGQNTQSRNLQAGINAIKDRDLDSIFIIEDDDWYSPRYLKIMVSALTGFDVVGEAETLYWHVGIQKGFRNINNQHSSLFQTGFTPKMIPVFEDVLARKEKWIDIEFFKQASNVQFIKGMDLGIGIKGIPGRAGIGMGHTTRIYTPRKDNTTPEQRLILTTTYQQYHK